MGIIVSQKPQKLLLHILDFELAFKIFRTTVFEIQLNIDTALYMGSKVLLGIVVLQTIIEMSGSSLNPLFLIEKLGQTWTFKFAVPYFINKHYLVPGLRKL